MPKNANKNGYNKPRMTVLHTHLRTEAVRRKFEEEKKHPGCNCIVTGEQGAWKVRRDKTADEIKADQQPKQAF